MGNIVKKIVLTGGPCAGKSSSLELIENYLKEKGYIVYCVQESATELINSGVKPFGDNAIDMISFQDIILEYQLEKEHLIENIASTFDDDKNVVILYDRGVIDNKAYIGQEGYDKLLNKYDLKEMDLLDNYDLVIHLETAAKKVGYTKENNKARSEDKDKAIEMDNKTFDSWKYHKNLLKVKSYENFKDKQDKIISIIDNALEKNIRKQNKYLLNNFNYPLDDELFYIKQYYLESSDNLEHRLREITFKGNVYYYYTIQEKISDGVSYLYEDRRLKRNEILDLFNNSVIKKEISKVRKYVVIDNIKYSIDLFSDGKVLLESIEKPNEANFDIICDVTNDNNYLNYNLKLEEKKILKKTLFNKI